MTNEAKLTGLLNDLEGVLRGQQAAALAGGPCDTWKKLRPIVVELIEVLNGVGTLFPKAKLGAEALAALQTLLDTLCPGSSTAGLRAESATADALAVGEGPGFDQCGPPPVLAGHVETAGHRVVIVIAAPHAMSDAERADLRRRAGACHKDGGLVVLDPSGEVGAAVGPYGDLGYGHAVQPGDNGVRSLVDGHPFQMCRGRRHR